jgi:F-type H+-transporting ATPase subunit delta
VLKALMPRLQLSQMVQNFLFLVLDKNRFSALSSIIREYQVMADALAGRVRATVQTARPFGDSERATVKDALSRATGKDVTISWDMDASLIGGIVARVGDTVYDASVRARLAEIKKSLISNPGEALGEA